MSTQLSIAKTAASVVQMRIIGYEFKPQERADKDFADYVSNSGWSGETPVAPPAPATPIYADENGNQFVALPHEDGVVAVPFIPGSPADMSDGGVGSGGGFVPIEQMPSGESGGGGLEEMLAAMAETLPTKLATDWVGHAAQNLMLGAGPGGIMDGALSALGVGNPLASGPVAAVLAGALEEAGVGELGKLLPSAGEALMGGSTAGLADKMGTQAINSLLDAAGLDQIPGASMVSGYLGDQLGEVLQDTFTEGLDGLTDALSGLSELSTDGLFADDKYFGMSPSEIGAVGINAAADYLMKEWKVDDESSAAEHIANKAVTDNIGQLKDAMKNPADFITMMKELFTGKERGKGLPAVRITDLDDFGDFAITGVANIMFEKLPVCRVDDLIVGALSPLPMPISQGSPTVLSAGSQTAFGTAQTAIGSSMVGGAQTILVGRATTAVKGPSAALPPLVAGNRGPAAPAAPASTSSRTDIASSGHGNPPQTSMVPAESISDSTNKPVQPATSTDVNLEDGNRTAGATNQGQGDLPSGRTQDSVLEQLLRGDPLPTEPQNISHSSDGVFLEGDFHKQLVVVDQGETVVFEAMPSSGWFLAGIDTPVLVEDDGHRHRFNEIRLQPPPGQSHAQFVRNVLGSGRNAVHNSGTMVYAVAGGEGVPHGTVNSNSTIREILRDANYNDYIPTFAPGINLNTSVGSISLPDEMIQEFDGSIVGRPSRPGDVSFSKPHVNDSDPAGPGAIQH